MSEFEKADIIISDDLTGAMDAGVQLVKKGRRVQVLFDSKHISDAAATCDTVILSTESRNITPFEAKKKIMEASEGIRKNNLKVIYKKIDSTLRGNLGGEIAALLEEFCYDMVVVVPALPYCGRTTLEGVHYINGIKINETDIGKDPLSPVEHSFIPNILKQQTKLKTDLILINEVKSGEAAVRMKLEGLHEDGVKIAVFDAEEEADLDVIAQCLLHSSLNIMPCGSAGLLSKMHIQKSYVKNNAKPNKFCNPVLVLSGSPAKAAKTQIKRAEETGYKVIRIDTDHFDKLENYLSIVESIAQQALSCIEKGESLVIDAAGTGKSELLNIYKDNKELLSDNSKRVQKILCSIFEKISEQLELAGVVIIGGDTAFSICHHMKYTGIEITGEVEPFIPSGILRVGQAYGMPLVTKAGGLGSPDVIIKAIEYLKGGDSNARK